MKDISQIIKDNKIIAIVRGIDLDKILDTCKALYEGGIVLMEVTFNQSSPTGNEDTAKAIKLISDHLPDVCVGAGTVMTVEQAELAIEAGAKYIISPNFDIEVVNRTIELEALAIPGVLTPTEITEAYKAGASFAKVFPSGTLGLNYLKAIMAPISHIPMMAVGGVDVDNVAEFMSIGLAGVGVGSSLVNRTLINEGRFEELTELASEFVSRIKE